jgi:hypothetical protein
MTKLKKTKLSFAFSLLVLFLTASLFWNCEAEREFMHNNTKNNNEITFEQFKNETGLVNFKTKIKVNTTISNSLLRTTNGSYELSDFNISTDIIKKLEANNIKSYTFRIYPKESTLETEKSIFNLTLVRINNIWKATIIEFKPTESNLERIRQGLTEKIEGKVAVLYDGTYENNNFQVNTDGCVLVTITVITCVGCTGSSDANDPEGCPQGICSIDTSSFFWCADLGDSGGGFFGIAPGDGVGTMPGGGIGNGDTDIFYDNTNPANEDPRPILVNTKDTSIDGILIDEDDILPCEQLKKLGEINNDNNLTPNLKNNIDDVKQFASENFPHEVMYNLIKDGYGNYGVSSLQISQTTNSAKPRVGPGFYGGIHSHWWRLYGMFSWSDVYSLKRYYDNTLNTNKSEVVLLLAAKECLTCSNVIVYAIKISDITTFNQKIAADLNNDGINLKEKIKAADDKFFEKLNLNMNSQDLEKVFLENFENSGIKLYKAQDDTYTNWDELSLSGNPVDPILKSPCN